MKTFWAFPALLLAVALSVSAEPYSSDRYSQALDRARATGSREAVDILWELVREQPEHPQAEQALIQIASICQKKLGDFDRAEQAYGLLIERSPESRRAALAGKRLAELRRARESGDEPLRLYYRIRGGYGRTEIEAALREIDELLSSYPEFVYRDHLLFLTGTRLASERRYTEATRYLEELLETYPESQWAYTAADELGKGYIELRRFDAAEKVFESFRRFQDRDPAALDRAAHRIVVVRRFHLLQRLFFLSSAVAGLACLVWILGTPWRRLGWGDGVAALVVTLLQAGVFWWALSHMTQDSERLRPGLLYTWIALTPAGVLSTLWASTRRPGVGRALAASLLVFVAALAIAYTVYYQKDAANLLLDSIQDSGMRGVS